MTEISAGGVVFKRTGEQLYILMIEDRFGRWTWPKGKMEEGETVEATALREIKEETNVEGNIVQKLSAVGYEYDDPHRGRVKKVVHYFLVEAVDDDVRPQLEEISGTVWLTPEEAESKQEANGYANNAEVLKQALHLLKRGER